MTNLLFWNKIDSLDLYYINLCEKLRLTVTFIACEKHTDLSQINKHVIKQTETRRAWQFFYLLVYNDSLI